MLDSKENAGIQFFFKDFNKAFDDCMQTQLLLNRLEKMNVSPYTINLPQDFWTGRQQVNSHMSPYIPVQAGMPQGTNYQWPPLLAIFINDYMPPNCMTIICG